MAVNNLVADNEDLAMMKSLVVWDLAVPGGGVDPGGVVEHCGI